MPVWRMTDIWPASAAQTADWPRLIETWGSLERDQALKKPPEDQLVRGLSHLIFHIAACKGKVVNRVQGGREIQFLEGNATLEG